MSTMSTITVTVAMPTLQWLLLCLPYSDCCYAYLTVTVDMPTITVTVAMPTITVTVAMPILQ